MIPPGRDPVFGILLPPTRCKITLPPEARQKALIPGARHIRHRPGAISTSTPPPPFFLLLFIVEYCHDTETEEISQVYQVEDCSRCRTTGTVENTEYLYYTPVHEKAAAVFMYISGSLLAATCATISYVAFPPEGGASFAAAKSSSYSWCAHSLG